NYSHGVPPAGILAAIIAVCFAAHLAVATWRGPAPRLGVSAVFASLLILPLAFAFVAPALNALWLSRDIARLVADNRPPGGAVAAAGYAEPSLVFMLGTNTVLASAERAANHLTTARGALALIEAREDASFREALARRGWEPREVGSVAGLN